MHLKPNKVYIMGISQNHIQGVYHYRQMGTHHLTQAFSSGSFDGSLIANISKLFKPGTRSQHI